MLTAHTVAEILTIGDELLRGDIVDGNSTWLAAQLDQLGLPVARTQSVGDDSALIAEAVVAAAQRCRVLVVTGGLGPTDDDRTAAAVAQAAGLPLQRNDIALRAVKQRLASRGRPCPPNNEKQADLPSGAEPLLNQRGTAPGISLAFAGCQLFCLPGVPVEMRWLFDTYVVPWAQRHVGGRAPLRRTLRLFDIGESQVEDRLQGLLDTISPHGRGVSLHYRATFPEVHVTAIARARSDSELPVARRTLDELQAEAQRRLGHHVYATDQQTLAETVVAALREAGATVALAESCTGGLAGDLLTQAAGSSEVFELGIVAYANRIKETMLAVPQSVLDEEGAVSRGCVEAMARGVRDLAGATFGVALSGIAGPGGGAAGKPVGTVHFALADASTVTHLHRLLPYGRQQNKLVAAYLALWLVLLRLRGQEPSRRNS